MNILTFLMKSHDKKEKKMKHVYGEKHDEHLQSLSIFGSFEDPNFRNQAMPQRVHHPGWTSCEKAAVVVVAVVVHTRCPAPGETMQMLGCDGGFNLFLTPLKSIYST